MSKRIDQNILLLRSAVNDFEKAEEEFKGTSIYPLAQSLKVVEYAKKLVKGYTMDIRVIFTDQTFLIVSAATHREAAAIAKLTYPKKKIKIITPNSKI